MKVKIMLNAILEEKEKSLYWLSSETGIAYSTLHKMAHNKTNSISFNAIEKICTSLNCTPADLITLE